MDRFLNALQGRAAAQAQTAGVARFATVTSYNPNDGTAKVQLQPEGVQTGWLPVLSQWTGSGWGEHNPLTTGEQVFVIPQDGDAEHGVIVGRAWSDQMRPPAAAYGERLFRHQSGSQVYLGNDGTVKLTDAYGAAVNLMNNGTVAVTGVLSVTGSIKVNGTTVAVP